MTEAHRFHHPHPMAAGQVVSLDDEELAHAAGSLRLRAGDPAVLVDGAGHVADARLVEATRRGARLEIVAVRFEPRRAGPPLWLAPALVRGPRFDLVLEKGTELGVDVFCPLLTRHTEVRPGGHEKPERWRRLLVAAVKQCRRAWLPEIRPPQTPGELLAGAPFGRIRVAEPGRPLPGSPPRSPAGPTGAPSPGASPPPTLLAIGPEGGWHRDEIERFRAAGAEFISLGNNRLRAETAALALLAHELSEAGEFAPADPGTPPDAAPA